MLARVVVAGLLATGCGRPPAPAATPQRTPELVLAHVWGGVGSADRWLIDKPRHMAMAPDGRWVVVAGDEVAVFSVPHGERLGRLPAADPFGPIAVSPDSRRLAFVDHTRGCVAVWNAVPLREEACVGEGLRDGVMMTRIAFSPDSAALAIAAYGHLARWSIATRTQAWRVTFEQSVSWLAWPDAGTLVLSISDQGVIARDAGTAQVRWVFRQRVSHYLGSSGSDAVVIGELYDRDASGSLARLDLASGALRDLTTGVPYPNDGALLDDGTAVLLDQRWVAHRVRLGGRELGSFVLPAADYYDSLSASRDGRVALTLARQELVLWDLRAGAPIEIADAQRGAILALDADRDAVISAASDGSLVVRSPDGWLTQRSHTRAAGCAAWAVDARARRAACATGIQHVDASRTTHEWIDLAGGRRGDTSWDSGQAIAIDGLGMAWAFAGGRAAWIHDEPRGRARVELLGRSEIDIASFRYLPLRVRLVDGERSAAFGGARYSTTPHGERQGWDGLGLWLMDGAGEITQLDDRVALLDLASDRTGDRLAIAAVGSVEVWDRTGSPARWGRRWSISDPARPWHEPLRGPRPTIALAHDGTVLAVTEGDGRTIAIHDAASGARIAALAVGSDERFVTALAFGEGRAIYAGTSTGLVLALELRR